MLAATSLARLASRQALAHSSRASVFRSTSRLPQLYPSLRHYASQPNDAPTPAQQDQQQQQAQAQTETSQQQQQQQHQGEPQSEQRSLAQEDSLAATYFDLPGQSGASDRAARGEGRAGYRGMSSIEKRRQNLSRLMIALGLVGAGISAWSLSRPFESESWEDRRLMSQLRLDLGLNQEDELPEGLSGRYYRCKTRVVDLMDFLNKPAWDPLLPPPLPPTHQRPYTLLIELDDLLVHSEWTREHGWRTAKRPGIEEFLGYLSQFYEIVIFTEAPSYTAMPLLDKIDPLQYYFVYRLFRDSTRYYNKSLVKDLNYLGRDLSKVVMLDNEDSHTQLQPENSIVLPRWTGSPKDTSLVAHLPFLEAIGINNVPDVRMLIKAYSGKDIPEAFAERQAEYRRKHVEEWEAKKQKNPLTGFNVAGLFGMSPKTVADEPPPTFFEAERKRHMEHYQAEKNFFKANENKMLEAMEADRQRQMKEMGSSFVGFVENLSKGNVPKPPDHEEPGQQQK